MQKSGFVNSIIELTQGQNVKVSGGTRTEIGIPFRVLRLLQFFEYVSRLSRAYGAVKQGYDICLKQTDYKFLGKSRNKQHDKLATNNPDTVTATAILRKEKARLSAAGVSPFASAERFLPGREVKSRLSRMKSMPHTPASSLPNTTIFVFEARFLR